MVTKGLKREEPSKAEVEQLLRSERFVYQRMPVGHGLFTSGDDRGPTANIIFPNDLRGESILDIGACYGLFGYEAKRRNSGRTVCLEKDPVRYRQARILQEYQLYGRDVEISDEDFREVCRRERFDHVLLLNVIHHLAEPIAALRTIASCVQKRFVMEFPTFHDPKFSKGLTRLMAPVLNRMPLIGVSSQYAHDQTFIFTEGALVRILTDHSQLYQRITFCESPIKNRMIAICDK